MLIGVMLLVGGLLGLLGVRVLLLAARTREVPELLIGAFFVLLGPAGALRLIYDRIGSANAGRLGAITCLPVVAAMALVLVFTYRTFRPGVGWARVMLAVGLAALAVGLYVEVHGVEMVAGFEPQLIVVLPRAACLGWGAYEATRYYFMMRRRLTYGLADPVVANRFLLYASWTASLALIPTLRTCIRLLELAHVPLEWRLPFTLVSVVAAMTMFTAMFLNFWPPRSYLRWLRRGHVEDVS